MHSSLQRHKIISTDHIITSAAARSASPASGLLQKHARTWVCPVSDEIPVPKNILHHHTHAVAANQCCSSVVQTIHAPVDVVWSFVRRFDNPQAYKVFLKSCHIIAGDGEVGTLREVRVVSGLPAVCSTERLEILDDEEHVMSFVVVGGEHRLRNYRSVTTLHSSTEERSGGDGGRGSHQTVVVETYVVDVPQGNTKNETCAFVDTIVRCNLQSLAQIAGKFSQT